MFDWENAIALYAMQGNMGLYAHSFRLSSSDGALSV